MLLQHIVAIQLMHCNKLYIIPFMKAQIAIQNLLQKRLADAQAANPQYSLRAFSNKVVCMLARFRRS